MISIILISSIVLGGALAAVCLRNLVHCALGLTVSLGGVGILYLSLGAQFAGLAQVLVYIGAVAILIVFAILLTRGADQGADPILAPGWWWGLAVAILVAAVICGILLSSRLLGRPPSSPVGASVARIGSELMGRYVLPLEVIGLLLTAALVGAVVIALARKEEE